MLHQTAGIDQAEIEFNEHLQKFSHQIYQQPDANINQILAEYGDDRSLSVDEAWLGFKWKASAPEKYIPHAIIKNLIIKNKNYTPNHFIRLTIQKDFVNGKPVAVKEEIYIFEDKKKVLFLGRPVTQEDAEKLGFDPSDLSSDQVLFDVEHALTTNGRGEPIATWRMVRRTLRDGSNPQEKAIIEQLDKIVKSTNGLNIYLETLSQLNPNT